MSEVLNFFSTNKDAIIAAGVFIASFTSIFGVLIGSRSVKKQRISQFQENWIERLSFEVSDIVALISKYHLKALKEDKSSAFLLEEKAEELLRNFTRIRLSLDADNPLHEKLISDLQTYLAASPGGNRTMDTNDAEKAAVASARKVIKETRKKLLRGEL